MNPAEESVDRIRKLCEKAFESVDTDGSKFVDLQQMKAGMRLVFEELSEVPKPHEVWFELVFRNFDKDQDSLIHLNDFCEIVGQYHSHYLARQARTPAAMQHYAQRGERGRELTKQAAIFEDYEFFDKAGQGTFGRVVVVRHKETRQVRACKTIKGGDLDMIRTETQLLRSLDHPNILKLFEVYHDGASVHIVSELCEGGTLQERLDSYYPRGGQYRLVPEGLAALIMQQLLAAVACCHAKQIIHRDVKPENVLFVSRSKESALKLIDFGLAIRREDAERAARPVAVRRKGLLACCVPARRLVMPRAGTIHYFSPEMIRGEYTELTDVFACGIILYQLLTGVHPFYTRGVDDEAAVKAKIARRDVEFPPVFWTHISTDAKDLARRMLLRDPRERISAAEALKHRWFRDPLKPTLHGGLTASIFEGLREYTRSSRLKRALLRLLAHELTEIQTQDLRKKFLSLDRTGDGRLSTAELVEAMRAMGVQDVEGLLPPGGSISYNEFLAALSERKVKYGKHQLREAFRKLDQAGTGLVPVAQLLEIVGDPEALTEAGVGPDGLSFEAFCEIVDS